VGERTAFAGASDDRGHGLLENLSK
jgi:hypothetical protein